MNNNKIIGAVVLVLVLGGIAWWYFDNKKAEQPQNNQTQSQSQNQEQTSTPVAKPSEPEKVPDTVVAVMETNKGSFELTLNGKAAPKTVANFMKLAKEGFYKDLTFHRIINGVLIQGGDPKGDGTGGPGYTVPAEIGLKHTKGAIAMARLGDAQNPKKESSGSQFYITLQALTELDGAYTVFGYVTKGMDTVEKIGQTPAEPSAYPPFEQSVPLEQVVIKSVTIKQ